MFSRCRLFCTRVISTFSVRVNAMSMNADEPCIIYKKLDKIATIGLNRPDKRNALNAEMVIKIEEALIMLENDPDVLGGVLYGEGGNFCSGYDLHELTESSDDNTPRHFIHNKLTERFIKKPMMAAVNGYAVGAGFDLALWCDLRFIEEHAVVGCLQRRFGMNMSQSGIGRLQAIVGHSKAMEYLLLGTSINSSEAFQFGIANYLVKCGTAIGRAINTARDLSKLPQAALLADRVALYKQTFSKIHLKNSVIDEEYDARRNNVIQDIKIGAKLFDEGVGRHGKPFSYKLREAYETNLTDHVQ